MEIEGSTALVTGARRGMGREFVRQLLDRGSTKVYATVRDASGTEIDGAELLELDVTDPASIARAAGIATDVSLVVSNAGISTYQPLVTGDLDEIRREMETHFWGTLGVIRAFAPALGRAPGGGGVLTMLSALSLRTYPGAGAYAAAKAAAWSLTDSVRLELAGDGTQVTGLFVGAVDTDMMAGYTGPMVRPADVVAAALDGLADGVDEVFADATARDAKASLADEVAARYAFLAG